ncbi:hypothetical protein [Acinetobacter nectaris]|uniref:hypothetical protein n=1 Tax=Acinetobacter nectaris TaxID=1219382 RepID=UPI001F282771|nr:hypothetical protein [Acinetobacter nectaris]MCF9028561.1 hypothetical protein [Acinetobacter nectaris]
MTSLKISGINIFEISNIQKNLDSIDGLSVEHIPFKNSKGITIACDSDEVDILVKIAQYTLIHVTIKVVAHLIAKQIIELIKKGKTAYFLKIGRKEITSDIDSKEIEKIISEELESALEKDIND